MNLHHKLLAAALAVGVGAAVADVAPNVDLPLVVNGDLRLNTSDFIAYTKIIPESNRTDFLTSMDRISKTVDGLWVRRMLAEKARRVGLDKDPEVLLRLQQTTDAILADRYMEKEVVGKIVLPNFEQRAREIYTADPEKFTIGETIRVQHILVDLKGRTREQAAARAQEAYDQASKGSKDFSVYARLYSDDPDVAKTGGDLGSKSPRAFTEKAWEVIGKLKVGEVAPPLESERGFSIFRVADRQPAKKRSFDEVKAYLVEQEKEKFIDAKKQEAVDAARADPKNNVYWDNINKLQVKVDVSNLPKVETNRP